MTADKMPNGEWVVKDATGKIIKKGFYTRADAERWISEKKMGQTH